MSLPDEIRDELLDVDLRYGESGKAMKAGGWISIAILICTWFFSRGSLGYVIGLGLLGMLFNISIQLNQAEQQREKERVLITHLLKYSRSKESVDHT